MTSDTVTVVGYDPLLCQRCEREIVGDPYSVIPVDARGWMDAEVYCSVKCANEVRDE